ncbi:peptidylprolyl isomerase [candidate division KSB1 bacterium]|nr:peptidylprolyl isomerase [candidate division KSB1 bacterium]
MIKKYLFIGIILISVVPAYGQQVLDKVLAIVDDDIILQSELMQLAVNYALQSNINPQANPTELEKLQNQVLDNMITQKILLAKAEDDTVEVSEREVDNVLDEQIDRMIEQLGSVEKVEEYLGSTISKIKRDFRTEVEDNLKVEQLKRQKLQTIQISRREVQEFYENNLDSLPDLKETVDISHILIQVKPGAEGEAKARKQIDDLLVRVKNGEDFAELARKYSEDPGSKNRGGELGFFQRGEFVREFEEVAFNLQPGEISDVVKSEHGFHIILMIERRGEKINVRHILIRLVATPEDAEATEKKVREIRQMLNEPGADFAEIAKKYSDDATTRDQGGHLGQFQLDEMQEPEFKRVIAGMDPGEISEPFQTRFGWHILKLNSREDARELTIDKDWEQVERWALNHKQQEVFKNWVSELKKDTFVDIKK